MKSELQIRNLLERLSDMNDEMVERDDFDKYVSPIQVDQDGKPMVFERVEATAIVSNMLMAMKTLEWVLGESMAVRLVQDEREAERYKDQIGVDGHGREYIPDTSEETFIAGMEGEW